MAAINSSVLACSYAISGTGSSELGLSSRLVAVPSPETNGSQGRRAALVCLGAALFATATSSSANAGPIEDALERSKSNKDLNDQKRLATSGANFYRAYTVQFGSCNFP